MTVFKSKRLSYRGFNWAAMVLVVCFGVVGLLGCPVHDHDLDPSHVDLDCASCYLAYSNIGLEHHEPDLFAEAQETQAVSIEKTTTFLVHTSFFSSRAPPVICWSVFLTTIQKLVGPWNSWEFSSFSKWVYLPSPALENYPMRKRKFCIT